MPQSASRTAWGLGQAELALAGGRDGREEEPDLATQLRDAWRARQGREVVRKVDVPEREVPQDLASREAREAEERAVAQDVVREQERVKELERQQEIERDDLRDRGHVIER